MKKKPIFHFLIIVTAMILLVAYDGWWGTLGAMVIGFYTGRGARAFAEDGDYDEYLEIEEEI